MHELPTDHRGKFFEHLQHLLVEGEFVTTYKYALLIALTRWAVEHADHDESVPVDVAALATHYVELYWPQTQPFCAPPSGFMAAESSPSHPASLDQSSSVLLQDRGHQESRVLRLIREAQHTHGLALHALASHSKRELFKQVRKSIRDMPLWRLQKIKGGDELNFLYEKGESCFEIVFYPGVVGCLARFAPLIEEIVRAAWLCFVLKCNGGLLGVPATSLEDFLFPRDRRALDAYRPVLMDLQENLCFYCGREMKKVHVDHFLPWSRYPRDLGHNFVLADSMCNTHKSDHLASVEHLEHWCQRNTEHGTQLARDFDQRHLPHDLSTLQSVARTLYQVTDDIQAPVWLRKDRLVGLNASWKTLLRRETSEGGEAS